MRHILLLVVLYRRLNILVGVIGHAYRSQLLIKVPWVCVVFRRLEVGAVPPCLMGRRRRYVVLVMEVLGLLLHYLLGLLVDLRHEVELALFILIIDNPGHLLLLVEHATIHDELFFLPKIGPSALFPLVVAVLTRGCGSFGDELGFQVKFSLL
jgi:hypothetical protein